jgi:hypothetical protein
MRHNPSEAVATSATDVETFEVHGTRRKPRPGTEDDQRAGAAWTILLLLFVIALLQQHGWW